MAKEVKLNLDEIQNVIENIKKRNYDQNGTKRSFRWKTIR